MPQKISKKFLQRGTAAPDSTLLGWVNEFSFETGTELTKKLQTYLCQKCKKTFKKFLGRGTNPTGEGKRIRLEFILKRGTELAEKLRICLC